MHRAAALTLLAAHTIHVGTGPGRFTVTPFHQNLQNQTCQCGSLDQLQWTKAPHAKLTMFAHAPVASISVQSTCSKFVDDLIGHNIINEVEHPNHILAAGSGSSAKILWW